MAVCIRKFLLEFRMEVADCNMDFGQRDSASGMSETQSSASSPAFPLGSSLTVRQLSGPCR
jgi:hypothetical protein